MRKDGTIIVVDDSPADRELINLCLRGAGASADIHLLSGGAEAVAYLKGDEPFGDREKYAYPALIITDLKMPGLDGLAVLEFLQMHPELAVIPTVVLSGSADVNDVEISYLLGASSYIVKPSSTAELLKRMKLLVEYWRMCEAPPATKAGLHVRTTARGKIGERYSRWPPPEQERSTP